jgi:hypothetical protein
LFAAALDAFREFDLGRFAALVGEWVVGKTDRLQRRAAMGEQGDLRQQVPAHRDFAGRIFGERNADRFAEAIAKQRTDADGALDAPILAFAGLGDSEVDGVIPVRPQLVQARDEQPVTLDHDLRIARLHREHEVVEMAVARDAGEFEGALDHAERRIAVAVHDPVAQRTVVRADAHGPTSLPAEIDQGGKLLLDPLQLRFVLGVAVFLDGKLLRVGVVAGIDAHLLDPLRSFKRGVRFEMDVRDDRHMAIPRPQFTNNVFEIRRILHRGRRDAHDLAADLDQFERLADAERGIHGVAGQHGLHDHGMRPADDDAAARGVAYRDFARLATLILERRKAVAHVNEQGPRRVRTYWNWNSRSAFPAGTECGKGGTASRRGRRRKP